MYTTDKQSIAIDSSTFLCKSPLTTHPLYRALKYRTPAEQQPDRAIELGAKQASYESLNARQLRKVPLARRDLIWAATEQCGLSDAPAVPPGVLADAETVARAAQRNELLRVQGVSTVWDHVTEMEVTYFWREERGLEKGSTYLKQLLKFAAKKTAGVIAEAQFPPHWHMF